MSDPTKQSDPFNDNSDPTVPLLSLEQEHPVHERPNDLATGESQSLDGPPVYQHPYFASDDKHSSTPVFVPQPSVPAVAMSSVRPPNHTISVTIEANWYETLRELQENLTDLRRARGRASRFATLVRVTPQCLRPRNLRGADESAREVRVLEELVLAGMRRLATLHPDPLIQAEWDSRAEQFSHTLRYDDNDAVVAEGSITLNDTEAVAANDLEGGRGRRFGRRVARLVSRNEQDAILMGLAKGVGILLFTPVALAGAAAFGAGAMLYGSGKIIVGLGHLMTFGRLRS